MLLLGFKESLILNLVCVQSQGKSKDFSLDQREYVENKNAATTCGGHAEAQSELQNLRQQSDGYMSIGYLEPQAGHYKEQDQ